MLDSQKRCVNNHKRLLKHAQWILSEAIAATAITERQFHASSKSKSNNQQYQCQHSHKRINSEISKEWAKKECKRIGRSDKKQEEEKSFQH